MLRDVFNYIQQQTLANMPTPGLSAVTPSPGATGVVALSGYPLGTFYGLLQVLTDGPLGTATAKLSLNAGPGLIPAYQSSFTVPSSGTYGIQLEQPGSVVFSLPSGLALAFSGTFTSGDTYTFTASAAPDFRLGEEHLPEQDRIFPSIVLVPSAEDFVGTEDWGGTQTILNSPRAVAMGENIFSASCWGIDYERTELLKNQLIYGIKTGVPSPSRIVAGKWSLGSNSQNKSGREYVLTFTVKIPVLELDARDTVAIAPPHLVSITPQVSS